MIKLVISFILLALLDFNDIAKINALKEKAEEAFTKGNYELAAQHYSMLIDSMQVTDERALLNLGHAYYQLKDSSNAVAAYQDLTRSALPKLKSIAYQQLGMLNSDGSKLQNALQYFKESIKADPTNEQARYNYELIKKKLKEQQEQEQQNQDQQNQDQQKQEDQKEQKDQQKQDQQQNQDQQNQDQQQQDQNQQNQEQQQENQEQQQNQEDQQQQNEEQENQQQQNQSEESEEKEGDDEQNPEPQQGENQEKEEQQAQPSPSDKLEEMKLSEEKAKMILEAMRNSEIQYIQQMRKKPTKKPDNKKPDW